MMRSLYSGVAGLKTHQTKMDVIGNNISNVNTVAFKASSTTFSDIMYQTTSGATGATATTGGKNAKQIGLGVTNGATKISITSAGAAQSTGDAFDIRITDSKSTSFFVVSNGTENLYTRAGAFYIDGNGNLAMTTTGYMVMGWEVNEKGELSQELSALRIMQEKNMTSEPEYTQNATFSGVIDKNDTDVTSSTGYLRSTVIYDNLGYPYTAKFAFKDVDADSGKYSVELVSILDEKGNDIVKQYLDNQGDKDGIVNDDEAKLLSNIFGINTTATDEFSTTKNYKMGEYTIYEADGTTVDTDGDMMYYVESGITYVMTGQVTETVSVLDPNTATTTNQTMLIGYEFTPIKMVEGKYQFDTSNPTKQATLVEIYGIGEDSLSELEDSATGKKYSGIIMDSTNPQIPGDNGDYKFTFADDLSSLEFEYPTVNYDLAFDTSDGTFAYVSTPGTEEVDLHAELLGDAFTTIKVDFHQLLNFNNGGSSTVKLERGAPDGTTGTGKKLGAMTGVSIDGTGKIFGSYDNGNTVFLGQICVAQFANASGLESVGNNCYNTTLNSGDANIVKVNEDGGSMSTGQLEMSNVDLSGEFTDMIVTQRGFQANSRIITVSDTLLEELINLKR